MNSLWALLSLDNLVDFLALSWASLWPSAEGFSPHSALSDGSQKALDLSQSQAVPGTSDYVHLMCSEVLVLAVFIPLVLFSCDITCQVRTYSL